MTAKIVSPHNAETEVGGLNECSWTKQHMDDPVAVAIVHCKSFIGLAPKAAWEE
jgi:hypothetical protein